MSLRISGAAYAMYDGFPELHLTVNGRRAVLVHDQQKPTLTDAGLTFLGAHFDAELPRIHVQVPGEPGNVLELTGVTDDRRVAALYRRFLADCARDDFPVGPVPVPAA